MNTYAKYCPNVYLAKCEEKHEKGDIIEVTKVRKDGTKSQNLFSSCELPAFDDVFTIEIVE